MIGAQDTLAAALYKQVKTMALNSKKYERIFSKTGSDADKISTNSFNEIKQDFDENRYLEDASEFSVLGPVLYQLQQMQDELDALRTEISTNKDKATFPGFGTSSTTALVGDTSLLALGTSSSTALAGDTTTISTSQASAITANTAKVSLEGGTSTAISFGEMVTIPPKSKGGSAIYYIVMTVTKSGVSKSITLTLT